VAVHGFGVARDSACDVLRYRAGRIHLGWG
jgi:hypothetical protein